MAKKKNVADLAQEALNSAALFDDAPVKEEKNTAEKNSEGERLPEDFFASAVQAESLPENEAPNEEPAVQDDFTLMPNTLESDINEGEKIGEDIEDTELNMLAGEADTEFDGEADTELDVDVEASVFLQEQEDQPGFLPEFTEEQAAAILADGESSEAEEGVSLEGTELDSFESAQIEDVEFVEEERLESIVESILFASDRPVSLAALKLVFKGTNITTQKIKRTLDQLAVEYAGGRRGVTLEEAPGGFQLRTKIDNMEFMRRTLKARPFKLSGPALEVLSIVAYKQPTVKFEVDEIRGVESGHLLRALMEKNLVCFDGKSDLPGRPMQYGTTKKFLEIFGLRNLKELPTLSQIDELLPEGIGEEDEKEKATLATITDSMAEMTGTSYSQGEDELNKITEQLEEITTSSDFFEKEKIRQREKRDAEKAQNIREAMAMSEEVSNRDINWLKRYDEALAIAANPDLQQAVQAFDSEANEDPANDAEVAEGAADGDASLEAAENDGDEFDEENLEEELPFLGEADDIGEDDAAL